MFATHSVSRYRFGVLIAALILWFSSHHIVFARDTLAVAFSDLAPWKIINEGRFEGAYAELAREIALRMNMDVKFHPCPLKRCEMMLQAGEADMAIGLQTTPEREVYLHFLKTPYRLSDDTVFYVRKGDAKRLREYEDLYRLQVGMKRGAVLFDRFDRDARIRKQEVNKSEQNLEKLVMKRIDTFGIAEDQGDYLVASSNNRNMVEKADFRQENTSPRYPAIAKNSTIIGKLDQLEVVMEGIVKSGRLDAILLEHYYKKFGIPPPRKAMPW